MRFMASSFCFGNILVDLFEKTNAQAITPSFPLEDRIVYRGWIERTEERNRIEKTRVICSRQVHQHFSTNRCENFSTNMSRAFQWKQWGGTHMFIEERYVVRSWSSILQAVHPAIQTSRRSVACGSTTWAVETKLETSALCSKIKTERAFCWTTALLLPHRLAIPVKHRPFMTP